MARGGAPWLTVREEVRHVQRSTMPVPLQNPRQPHRPPRPAARRRISGRWVGMVGRMLLVALLCASTGGSLWAVSLAMAPDDAVPATAARPHLVELPPVPLLDLDRAPEPRSPAAATAAAPAPAATPMARTSPPSPDPPDPLQRWAAGTADLLGVPARELIGYGAADLATQQTTPGCRLSWITLAAIGRIGSSVRRQDGRAAALATAETLCSGGRDTSTADGWVPAVRSVGDGPAYVHQVLAIATTYATAVRTGTPLSPAARTAIDFAVGQIGLPYVWGGNGPQRGDAGFDCSGLTTAAYATAGVGLPRTAHTQYFATPRVDQLRPGDLVFYGNPATKIHHVGLYIGNGQMINAPTFGQPVQVESFRSPGDHFAGAGRPTS